MRDYDPARPLISLHVPKCAGQSMRRLLEGWFGARFFTHYFQERNAPPPRRALGLGTCVHGHFARRRGIGVDDYYPDAQLITVLRDPLEIAISNYFFWKHRARERQIAQGLIADGAEHDYRSIDDFFRKRPRSHLFDFLPAAMAGDDFAEVLEERFVWVGLAESLDDGRTIPVLAAGLGFAPAEVERVNASPRDEELSTSLEEKFIEENRAEHELYEYVRRHWGR